MINPRSSWSSFILIWLSLHASPSWAVFHGGVYLATAQFTKTSQDGSASAILPAGLGASANLFITPRFSLGGAGEINIETADTSVVFLGGEVLASWFLAGGDPIRIDANLFRFESNPRFNCYLFGGLAQRTFNFSAFEADTTQKLVRKSSDNISQGSFFGPVLGFGADIPTGGDLSVSLRAKVVQGLGSKYSPKVGITGFSIGLGVSL